MMTRWGDTGGVRQAGQDGEDGDQMLEHGLFGKNAFFEDSVRVPMLVVAPERIAPGVREVLTEAVDAMPTILEMCGMPVPAGVQGRSLLEASAREMVCCGNIVQGKGVELRDLANDQIARKREI